MAKSKVEDDKNNSDHEWRGGPPKVTPKLGKKVLIYDGSQVLKVDKDGRVYIGISIDELVDKEISLSKAESKEQTASDVSTAMPIDGQKISAKNEDKRSNLDAQTPQEQVVNQNLSISSVSQTLFYDKNIALVFDLKKPSTTNTTKPTPY